MLNKSKGQQCGRQEFKATVCGLGRMAINVGRNSKPRFYQEMVNSLIREGKIKGIRTALGIEIKAKSVVLTNGTFLNGQIHIGDKTLVVEEGESASHGITEDLINAGFEAGRMKTGTPPRVDGRSLDYSKMNEEKAMRNRISFLILIDLLL
jgi:tRNA uridine 5-carboxymethylaminomethyl modification enzyme